MCSLPGHDTANGDDSPTLRLSESPNLRLKSFMLQQGRKAISCRRQCPTTKRRRREYHMPVTPKQPGIGHHDAQDITRLFASSGGQQVAVPVADRQLVPLSVGVGESGGANGRADPGPPKILHLLLLSGRVSIRGVPNRSVAGDDDDNDRGKLERSRDSALLQASPGESRRMRGWSYLICRRTPNGPFLGSRPDVGLPGSGAMAFTPKPPNTDFWRLANQVLHLHWVFDRCRRCRPQRALLT
jgi:hypothetical protein